MKLDAWLLDNYITSAQKKVEECRTAWHDEKLNLVKMLAECKETHSSMPNNYWEKEFRLRSKYNLAVQLLNSLEESKENPNG